MTKPTDNISLVQYLMTYSDHGALAQMFVIDALTKWSKLVAEAPPIEHGLINGAAWKAVAQEISDKMAVFYGDKAA